MLYVSYYMRFPYYIYIYNRDPYRGHFISSRYPFLCCPGMSCYGLLSKDAALVKTLGEICGAKAWPGGEICDDGHGWLSCQKCCVFSMHAHTYVYIYIYVYGNILENSSKNHGTSWEIMEHIHVSKVNELMSCGQELPRLQVLLGEVMTVGAVACGDGGHWWP